VLNLLSTARRTAASPSAHDLLAADEANWSALLASSLD
jgi:hypothetical protein